MNKGKFKIIQKGNFIEWIESEKSYPFFRFFLDINAIPFKSNNEEKGKVLIACIFKDSCPEGYEIINEGNYIFLKEKK